MKTQIISFEAACAALGEDPNSLPDVSVLPEAQGKYLTSVLKIDTITRALNSEDQPEPWTPDYSNWNQGKYHPYFEHSPGSGWSYYDYGDWDTGTSAGARPFRTRELAKYAGATFIDLYLDILTYQNS